MNSPAGSWSIVAPTTYQSVNTCGVGCVIPATSTITNRRWGDLTAEFSVQINNYGTSDTNWAGITLRKAAAGDLMGTSGILVYYRANSNIEVLQPGIGVIAVVTTGLSPVTSTRRVRVELNGKYIRVLVDGTLFINKTVTVVSTAPGYVDLTSYGVTASYRDISIWFHDSFNRRRTFAYSASPPAPPEQFWSLYPAGSAFGTSENQMELKTLPGSTTVFAVPKGLSAGDFTADITMRVDSTADPSYWGAFSFRRASETDSIFSSGYMVYLRANGQLSLYKGNVGNIGQVVSLTCGLFAGPCAHQIRVVASGSSISVYADGELKITPPPDTQYSSGSFALATYGSQTRFQSLEIY
jgi:hypothetical protein